MSNSLIQKKWPQKIIEASWPEEQKVLYQVALEIKAEDRMGLFRDISSVISGLGINILSHQAESQPRGEAIINTKIEISGWEELDRLFGQLKQVKGIIEIRKV